MTLEERIIALAQAIGTDYKTLVATIGLLSNLETLDKTNIVAAINEVKTTADSATQNGVTQAEVDTTVDALRTELLGGAGSAYDTFKELEDLIVADETLTTALTTAVANRVRFDAAQTLTTAQKLQANQNTGVGDPDHDFVADYEASKL